MKINVLIVVMAILLANSGVAVSINLLDYLLSQFCSRPTLVTVNSGLPYATSVYIDGVLIPSGPSKSFGITRGSSILTAQLKKGAGHLAATAAKIFPAASKWVCTNTSVGTDNSWTRLAFDDSKWQFQLSLESVWSWTSNIFSNLNWVIKNVNTDIYCRAYLRCYVPPVTTTPVPVTSTAATTRAPSTTTKQLSTSTTTTTTAQPTTTTTTTTTTTAAPSLTPLLLTSVGGGNFQGGSPATLQCIFSATPAPTAVTWYLNGIAVNAAQSTLTQRSDGTWAASFNIQAVGVDTAGQYTCVATNTFGSSPASVIDVSVDYTMVQVLPSTYQLTGVNPQTILLQASLGCASAYFTILDVNTTQITVAFTYTEILFYPGDGLFINTALASFPDVCYNPYAWIWITIEVDSSVTVGVGPTPGQNAVLSSPPYTTYASNYLLLSTVDGTAQTYYIYN